MTMINPHEEDWSKVSHTALVIAAHDGIHQAEAELTKRETLLTRMDEAKRKAATDGH